MTNDLLFDFTVDKAAKTVFITREFDADLSLVWDAFTKAEILDQWVAPKPLVSKTKFMDFKVGGRRFYAMVSPEGQERWSIQKYTSISPKTNFKMFNAFADKDENPELPGSDWDYTFSEQNGKTTVSITIYNESLARMEKMIEMGFTEGFKASMNNLENLLATLSESDVSSIILIVIRNKQSKNKIMALINPHINFNGNAEEAFTFYKSVFGGEFAKIIRFKDLASPEFPVAEKEENKIMHIALPIGKSNILMANDVPESMGRTNENENRSKIVNKRGK